MRPSLGKSFWVAAIITAGFGLALYSEEIIHRFRTVFVVGRATDKLHYGEKQT
jgi:hypothetical protein